MTAGRFRVHLLFAMLGAVPVFLCVWLGWLQVLQGGSLNRGEGVRPLRLGEDAAARQAERRDLLPGPRGTIVDRNGATLAIDCPTYDVEVDVTLRDEVARDATQLQQCLDNLATRLAACLAADPDIEDRNDCCRRQRQRLLALLERAFHPDAGDATSSGAAVPRRASFFLASRIDALRVTQSLRQLDAEDDYVLLHWVPTHRRVYPDRDYTYGVVGWEEDRWVQDGAGAGQDLRRQGVFGIEASPVLTPGNSGYRDFLRDSENKTYWYGAAVEPAVPVELQTTLDLELQQYAMQVLRTAAVDAGHIDGETTPPQWGALVLIDIVTGDVMAMANWQREATHPRAMMATPYQCRYEPGSIVKPLVFAFALEHAGLDWNERIDCTPTLPNKGRKTAGGRVIHDDHACGVLTPHDVIVNSSNIGAVAVGAHLTRQQWRDYLQFYRLEQPSGLMLPHELPGVCATRWSVSEANFRFSSATALSIGYELSVSALGMARAYLTLLSGAQRELRLYRGIVGPGVHVVLPPKPAGKRELSAAVVDAVMAAMVDVVAGDSDTNHPTGSWLRKKFLDHEQLELHGLVAGKTGTAASKGHDQRGTFEVRNASFVGFAPAEAPRYLAVCVLQKDDDARFYGGRYAAPPVVRMLLHALEREKLRRLRQEPQVSASPGDSGWNGQVPEKGK